MKKVNNVHNFVPIPTNGIFLGFYHKNCHLISPEKIPLINYVKLVVPKQHEMYRSQFCSSSNFLEIPGF